MKLDNIDRMAKFSLLAIIAACGYVLHLSLNQMIDWRFYINGSVLAFLFVLLAVFLPSAKKYHNITYLSWMIAWVVLMYLSSHLFLSVMVLTPHPLVDSRLAAWDKMLGIDIPQIIVWARSMPSFFKILVLAYGYLLFIVLIALFFLCVQDDASHGRRVIMAVILCQFIAFALYYFYPAIGPILGYNSIHGFAMTQLDYMQDIINARTMQQIPVDIVQPFSNPAFHGLFVVILPYAFIKNRRYFLVASFMALWVLAASICSGWHYFVDIVFAIIIASVVVVVVERLYWPLIKKMAK